MPAPRISYRLPVRSDDELSGCAEEVFREMVSRRSCRQFSDKPVPAAVIERLVAIANTSPSGANRQPWRFVAISDPGIKRAIRIAAEKEEHESYLHRMPAEWLEALEPLGTDEHKPFLEVAPWLVVVFRIDWEMAGGKKYKNYYPVESVGLAAGFFIMAAHRVGLATLTHTPSPMGFLRDILGRPENEKPFLLIPVGHPATDCTAPDIKKKCVGDVVQWIC